MGVIHAHHARPGEGVLFRWPHAMPMDYTYITTPRERTDSLKLIEYIESECEFMKFISINQNVNILKYLAALVIQSLTRQKYS